MRRNLHALIREYLLATPDGATKTELVRATQAHASAVGKAVQAMVDVYIDRWIQRPGCVTEAVHVVVVVPEDCPPAASRSRRVRPREIQQEMKQ